MEIKWESLPYQIKTNFFRSCQRKNEKTTKEFNKMLIQIFVILVWYIFRLSDKVKPLGNTANITLF